MSPDARVVGIATASLLLMILGEWIVLSHLWQVGVTPEVFEANLTTLAFLFMLVVSIFVDVLVFFSIIELY